MAHALRLRRALSLSTAILSPTRRTTVIASISDAAATLNQTSAATIAAVRHFHSTQKLSSSYAQRSFNSIDKIDADSILFEGCDYNHFLIVLDFGKDPNQRPPPDQMIETYVQTAAKVLGSVEEAKRKIYACSTTTYTGFQVEVDEETSKKFEGLPGVTFVLPDSYVDPVNKEYGGDKYLNGEIVPRPPPVHNGRRDFKPNVRPQRDPMPIPQGNPSYNQQGNRASNQQGNPAYNQVGNPAPAYNQVGNPAPAYNQAGNPAPAYNQVGNPAPAYNQLGNRAPAYNQLGSMPQGGRGYPPQGPQHQSYPSQQNYPPQQNYLPQQNYPPQQNYGPSGQADRGSPAPGGAHYPRDGFQGGQRNFVPSQEGNYNRDYNHPQGQMSNQPGNHGGYAPPGQFRTDLGNYQPEGQRGNQMRNHDDYQPRQIRNLGDNRSSFSSPVAGAYGQTGAGNYEQNEAPQYSQGPNGNNYGPGAGYIPGSIEQSNPLDHGINSPGAQMGFNQGGY